MNPHFRRIIKGAGLMPWERTWHNLRASWQTQMAATFPLATVCAWIGNSKAIAAGHYLQVTDADWTRATGARESGAESGGIRRKKRRSTCPHWFAPIRPTIRNRLETRHFTSRGSRVQRGAKVTNGQSRT